MRLGTSVLLVFAAVAPLAAADRPAGFQAQGRATFKASVDRVTVTAVVHKKNGQPVTNLTREDFEILDNGRAAQILEFRAEPTPGTVALLVDFSGSMNFASKTQAARAAASQVVSEMTP